jgi:hypothetical protein
MRHLAAGNLHDQETVASAVRASAASPVWTGFRVGMNDAIAGAVGAAPAPISRTMQKPVWVVTARPAFPGAPVTGIMFWTIAGCGRGIA